MGGKTYTTRPIGRLWGALKVCTLLYIAAGIGLAASTVWRASLLSAMPADAFMSEMEVVPGSEIETLLTGVFSLLWLPAYFIGIFLTLKWFMRATRNANALVVGMENSPAWALWGFFIPVLSLFKPYSVMSELWRSSQSPDRWKGLKDPAMLRWWWAAVLIGGFLFTVVNFMTRGAASAGHFVIVAALSAVAMAIHVVAGFLFLRIAGPISERQSALISSGRTRPATLRQPAWAP